MQTGEIQEYRDITGEHYAGGNAGRPRQVRGGKKRNIAARVGDLD